MIKIVIKMNPNMGGFACGILWICNTWIFEFHSKEQQPAWWFVNLIQDTPSIRVGKMAIISIVRGILVASFLIMKMVGIYQYLKGTTLKIWVGTYLGKYMAKYSYVVLCRKIYSNMSIIFFGQDNSSWLYDKHVLGRGTTLCSTYTHLFMAMVHSCGFVLAVPGSSGLFEWTGGSCWGADGELMYLRSWTKRWGESDSMFAMVDLNYLFTMIFTLTIFA